MNNVSSRLVKVLILEATCHCEGIEGICTNLIKYWVFLAVVCIFQHLTERLA